MAEIVDTEKKYASIGLDLEKISLRELNHYLHKELPEANLEHVDIYNPNGLHNIAVGVDSPVSIDIHGHAGYFIAGMNKHADVTIHGNVGWSVAENIMSGMVRVKGNASECVAASGHGGLVIIEGDASSRCGISMKGCNIVVGGNVGHMSAFMAQLGHLVICGNADHGLGDSLYEAVIYVRGEIAGLGADARIEPMQEEDYKILGNLLEQAGFDYDSHEFKRVGSARTLYHWNSDVHQEY